MPRGVAKVPQVMQMEALECGAACLTMILAYYGRWEPLEKVRVACGVSRDGSKASNILKAARTYGMEAKGRTYPDAATLQEEVNCFPCVVFWNFNHYIVVDGFKGKNVYVNDPARGQLKMSVDEFEESFSGIALEFSKTERFVEGGTKPNVLAFVKERLVGLRGPIVFVMATAAITSLITIITTSAGQVFMDRIITGKNPPWLLPLLGLLLGLAIVSGVVAILNATRIQRIQGKIAVVSSSRFMHHLLYLPAGFFDQRMVGDLQQRQSSNESIAYTLVVELAPVLINVVMLGLYLVIMLRQNVLLTLVGVSTVVLNAIVARMVSKRRVNAARSIAADTGKLYATTVGAVNMVETIKASGAENGYFERWAGFQASVNEGQARLSTINDYVGAIPEALTRLANIGVLVMGIYFIVKGNFTTGALFAFQGFLSAFMSPVSQIIGLGQTVQEMQTQMERVDDVLKYETDVPEEPIKPSDVAEMGSAKLSGKVDLTDVSFGYSPLADPLIDHFDLHLEPGKWVALVGGSGSGKSTIAKLISGLYKPWSGSIEFDGTGIQDVPRPILRGSLAVVDQDVFAFDGTVSESVKLWDHSIEDYEVTLACRDAGIHDTIARREGGYSSLVMPGGRNFSGGQLQRLEIARALAQDPTIIILDEATSALDAKTEAEVIKRIRERGITCIVVAHRLSTIRDCDEIVVLEKGKVVERGIHDELLAAEGAYAKLVRSN